MEKLKLVSLFCGCGGADLGCVGGFEYLGRRYSKNPIKIIHASDIDPKAVRTYNRNFQEKAVTADVREIKFSGMEADIVMGGFPCQNFSTVNPNKNPENKNNQLFWELNRAISEIKPKVFIAENVRGFYHLKNGAYFNEAKRAFESAGYDVFAKVLNAADYGVPQLRERVIIVGVRKDAGLTYFFPEPTHERQRVPLKTVITSLNPPHEKYYFSKRAVEGVKRAKPNMKRALAQNLNAPCLTITSHLAKVSLNSRDPVILVDEKKEIYRRFTPHEAAKIQSFPDRFVFDGSESDAYRQIGNAVPPLLMWNIVKSVIKQIF